MAESTGMADELKEEKAMTANDNLPAVVWSGTMRLFGVELVCHVLDDGQRIIEQESVAALFEAMGRPHSSLPEDDEINRISEFIQGRGVPGKQESSNAD